MNDEATCIELLPRVSRTFALSIEALPEPLRRTVRSAYLLCRIVDTIEDDPDLERDERERLFALFQRLMADDGADTDPLQWAYADRAPDSDDAELCRRSGAVFRSFRALPRPVRTAIRPHVFEMATGMAHFARRWRGSGELTVLSDLDDLHRYCYFVAGTVGILLTDTFVAIQGDALTPPVRRAIRQRAVRFGHGLQMTNILRDVRIDHTRGWCFLPATLCRQRGVEPEALLDPPHRPRAMGVIDDVAAVASEHLDHALEYTLRVPPGLADLRLFLIVPLALAHGTLSLVRADPQVLSPGGLRLSRETVAAVIAEAGRQVGDDDALRRLCVAARDRTI